jgi:hypothetical protein
MQNNLVHSHRSGGVNSARSGGITVNSAQDSKGTRQRSQKRGNKNLNQKEVRQKQDLTMFYPRGVSTPTSRSGAGEYTQQASLNNYGKEDLSLSQSINTPIKTEANPSKPLPESRLKDESTRNINL